MSDIINPYEGNFEYRKATPEETAHLRAKVGKLIATVATTEKLEFQHLALAADPGATLEQETLAKQKFFTAQLAQDRLVDDFGEDELLTLYEAGCEDYSEDSLIQRALTASTQINNEYNAMEPERGEAFMGYVKRYRAEHIDRWNPFLLKARTADEEIDQKRWRDQARYLQRNAKDQNAGFRKKLQEYRDKALQTVPENVAAAEKRREERREKEGGSKSQFTPDIASLGG